jgi:hypothetical protein
MVDRRSPEYHAGVISHAQSCLKLARGGAINPYFPMFILLKAAATS